MIPETDYFILRPGADLPPAPDFLYRYVIARRGGFVQARRPGLDVLVPAGQGDYRGLGELAPYVRLEYPLVPQCLVESMLTISKLAGDCEVLFHLWSDDAAWKLAMPDQQGDAISVRPLDEGPDSSYAKALIEVHSHHKMKAFFSAQDDRDERQGFRIYGVLGDIFNRPTLLVRVGCHGYLHYVAASSIFELPTELHAGPESVDASDDIDDPPAEFRAWCAERGFEVATDNLCKWLDDLDMAEVVP